MYDIARVKKKWKNTRGITRCVDRAKRDGKEIIIIFSAFDAEHRVCRVAFYPQSIHTACIAFPVTPLSSDLSATQVNADITRAFFIVNTIYRLVLVGFHLPWNIVSLLHCQHHTTICSMLIEPFEHFIAYNIRTCRNRKMNILQVLTALKKSSLSIYASTLKH